MDPCRLYLTTTVTSKTKIPRGPTIYLSFNAHEDTLTFSLSKLSKVFQISVTFYDNIDEIGYFISGGQSSYEI